ncbi:MAG: hypothetical protein JSU08_03005 [Acidobacteria bacterium]|nr:hypothetical protein [Acidobacteriota bacterium]
MAVEVDDLMREIEDDVRRMRRKRLLARGGADDYRDPAIYAGVDQILRRAIDARDHDALLLPDFLTSEAEWDLALHLKYASHRPIIGAALVAVKRRLLLPMMRWLYEYSLENFRKQRRINTVLFACIEELAIENARLRRAMLSPSSDHALRAEGGSGTQ